MPKASKSKSCFVICPIGEKESPERKRSDQVLKHIITPAVKECGYEVVRADKISKPGIITQHIIQRLIEDDLVVADLTGANPNVFYELAIRHMVRKPVIQIIRAGERIPFDVASARTIFFDHKDLDSAHYCRDEIVKQIRMVEKGPTQVDNPISIMIDTKSLRQSENPVATGLAEIMQLLRDIRVTQQRRKERGQIESGDLRYARISAYMVQNCLDALDNILTLEADAKATKARFRKAQEELAEAIGPLEELIKFLEEFSDKFERPPRRRPVIRRPYPKRRIRAADDGISHGEGITG